MDKIGNNSILNAQHGVKAINQIRDAVNLVADQAAAFDIVLEQVLIHFDSLNSEEREEAIVRLILSKNNTDDDLSISLQDILTTFSTIKNDRRATKGTIIAITNYEDTCDLDLVLARGIERYNDQNKKQPVRLKKDWVEVVTHDVKDLSELDNKMVRHFLALNRDANNDLCIPSDCLLDTWIAALLIVKQITNPNKVGYYWTTHAIDLLMTSLQTHPLVTEVMKQTLTDYRKYADFDVLLAGVAQRYKNSPQQPVNTFRHVKYYEKLQNNWNIMYPYLSWKDWGRLGRTCHHMNNEFQAKMQNSLKKPFRDAIERNRDKLAMTLSEIRILHHRIPSQIPINREGIRYIQDDEGIKCGPNALIEIKTDYSCDSHKALERVRERFNAKDDALRAQFVFLDDAQFAPIRKYCIDGFISATALAGFPQDAIKRLADYLIKPDIQFYVDQIALDIDQPVCVDTNAFFSVMHVSCVEAQLEAENIYAYQLLKVTDQYWKFFNHQQVDTLFKKDSFYVKKNRGQFSQLIALSADDLAKLLKLMSKDDKPLILFKFLQLSPESQRLLLDTEMYTLIDSGAIMSDDFFAVCAQDRQRLSSCLNDLVAVVKSDRSESKCYALKNLMDLVTDKDNFNPLSILIHAKKLSIKTLNNLSHNNKNRLCKSVSLQEFLKVTNDVSIEEFFKLPAHNQEFIEFYWSVFDERVKSGEITWTQIKNSSKFALEIFHSQGTEKYIECIKVVGSEWVVTES